MTDIFDITRFTDMATDQGFWDHVDDTIRIGEDLLNSGIDEIGYFKVNQIIYELEEVIKDSQARIEDLISEWEDGI